MVSHPRTPYLYIHSCENLKSHIHHKIQFVSNMSNISILTSVEFHQTIPSAWTATSGHLGRGHTKETGNRNATAISENCYRPKLNTLLNGAAQIEETATQCPQFAQLPSVTCVQLRLIRILGNCGCQFPCCALALRIEPPIQWVSGALSEHSNQMNCHKMKTLKQKSTMRWRNRYK
jgi:hypothetical protein